jgi:hypothetical protein
MGATATIAAVGTAHRCEFITHKMFAAGAAMSAPAKNAYLVNKIALLQNCIFTECYEGFGFSHNRSSTNNNRPGPVKWAGCKYTLSQQVKILL